jgi:MFS family permease
MTGESNCQGPAAVVGDPGPGRRNHEGLFGGSAAALFSFAMGLSAVAAPLLALASGFHASEVGVYVAGSAIAQLATRSFMGPLMRVLPDKYLVLLAGGFMAASCGIFVGWTAWWAFLGCQVFQGVARGFFWTGTQTHAVRTSGSAVAAIAQLNLISGIGLVAGPLLAGPIVGHWSGATAMGVATVFGLTVAVPAVLMERLPPMRPQRRGHGTVAVWRRPGVGLANWGGASAGAWRSLMNSFVPVVLDQARQSSAVIGGVVGAANAASIVSGAAAGRIREARLRQWLVGGVVVTGLGLAAFGLLSSFVVLAGVALVVSGAGAGLLQTVGPAMATEAVEEDERGEAIASAGTFRAAALLATPLGVAGLVLLISAPAAMAVAGVALVAPTLSTRRARA